MDGVSDGIVQWCDWCEDWVIITPGSDHEVSHFSNRLEHAINSVKEYGYGGCHDGTRPLVPEKCIFCLHNPEIAAKDRLFFPLSPENRLNHIQNHLKSKEAAVVEETGGVEEIEGADSAPRMLCPASAIAGTDVVLCQTEDTFDLSGLKKHLETVHGVACPRDSFVTPYEKLKKKRAAKAVDESRAPLADKPINKAIGKSAKRKKGSKEAEPEEIGEELGQGALGGSSARREG
jgi:hypothetical protein